MPIPNNANAPPDELGRGAGAVNSGETQHQQDSAISAKPHGLLQRYLYLRNAAIDNRLDGSAVAVLAIVLEHLDRGRRGFPGCDRMSHLTGLHRTTIMRGVEQLEATGWVLVTRRPNRANEYRVPAWPTTSDWPDRHCLQATVSETGSADATGSVHATGRMHAQDRSHARTRPVAPVRPEPALNPVSNPVEQKLSLASLAEPVQPTRFAEFWAAYPRKVGGTAKALKSWTKQKLDRHADQILADVTARTARDPQWRKRQFIPHPLTYLNNQRWQDEWDVPAAGARLSTPTPEESDAAAEAALRRLEITHG